MPTAYKIYINICEIFYKQILHWLKYKWKLSLRSKEKCIFSLIYVCVCVCTQNEHERSFELESLSSNCGMHSNEWTNNWMPLAKMKNLAISFIPLFEFWHACLASFIHWYACLFEYTILTLVMRSNLKATSLLLSCLRDWITGLNYSESNTYIINYFLWKEYRKFLLIIFSIYLQNVGSKIITY